ncbi:hypothetical protein KUTeg_001956, partial [Tegillarca granosa]
KVSQASSRRPVFGEEKTNTESNRLSGNSDDVEILSGNVGLSAHTKVGHFEREHQSTSYRPNQPDESLPKKKITIKYGDKRSDSCREVASPRMYESDKPGSKDDTSPIVSSSSARRLIRILSEEKAEEPKEIVKKPDSDSGPIISSSSQRRLQRVLSDEDKESLPSHEKRNVSISDSRKKRLERQQQHMKSGQEEIKSSRNENETKSEQASVSEMRRNRMERVERERKLSQDENKLGNTQSTIEDNEEKRSAGISDWRKKWGQDKEALESTTKGDLSTSVSSWRTKYAERQQNKEHKDVKSSIEAKEETKTDENVKSAITDWRKKRLQKENSEIDKVTEDSKNITQDHKHIRPDSGEFKVSKDAVKSILLMSDSPLLRARYNEAKRKRELSAEKSLDEHKEVSQTHFEEKGKSFVLDSRDKTKGHQEKYDHSQIKTGQHKDTSQEKKETQESVSMKQKQDTGLSYQKFGETKETSIKSETKQEPDKQQKQQQQKEEPKAFSSWKLSQTSESGTKEEKRTEKPSEKAPKSQESKVTSQKPWQARDVSTKPEVKQEKEKTTQKQSDVSETKKDKYQEKTSNEQDVKQGRVNTTILKSEKDERVKTSQQQSVSDNSSTTSVIDSLNFEEMSQLTRAERIAKYREERKKQLAYIADKFGTLGESDKPKDVVPSLFISSQQSANSQSPFSRSRSLREQSPQKTVEVSRSKSLKTDSSKVDSKPSDTNRKDTEPSLLDKARQRYLLGTELGQKQPLELKDDSITAKSKLFSNENEDSKNDKRRRQLPSIPAALGQDEVEHIDELSVPKPSRPLSWHGGKTDSAETKSELKEKVVQKKDSTKLQNKQKESMETLQNVEKTDKLEIKSSSDSPKTQKKLLSPKSDKKSFAIKSDKKPVSPKTDKKSFFPKSAKKSVSPKIDKKPISDISKQTVVSQGTSGAVKQTDSTRSPSSPRNKSARKITDTKQSDKTSDKKQTSSTKQQVSSVTDKKQPMKTTETKQPIKTSGAKQLITKGHPKIVETQQPMKTTEKNQLAFGSKTTENKTSKIPEARQLIKNTDSTQSTKISKQIVKPTDDLKSSQPAKSSMATLESRDSKQTVKISDTKQAVIKTAEFEKLTKTSGTKPLAFKESLESIDNKSIPSPVKTEVDLKTNFKPDKTIIEPKSTGSMVKAVSKYGQKDVTAVRLTDSDRTQKEVRSQINQARLVKDSLVNTPTEKVNDEKTYKQQNDVKPHHRVGTLICVGSKGSEDEIHSNLRDNKNDKSKTNSETSFISGDDSTSICKANVMDKTPVSNVSEAVAVIEPVTAKSSDPFVKTIQNEGLSFVKDINVKQTEMRVSPVKMLSEDSISAVDIIPPSEDVVSSVTISEEAQKNLSHVALSPSAEFKIASAEEKAKSPSPDETSKTVTEKLNVPGESTKKVRQSSLKKKIQRARSKSPAASLSRSKSITEKELQAQIFSIPQKTSQKPIQKPLRKLFETPDLDEILSKNAEYLSDHELSKSPTGKAKSKEERKLMSNEQPKLRRSLKKKLIKRRKSESDKTLMEAKQREDEQEEKEVDREEWKREITLLSSPVVSLSKEGELSTKQASENFTKQSLQILPSNEQEINTNISVNKTTTSVKEFDMMQPVYSRVKEDISSRDTDKTSQTSLLREPETLSEFSSASNVIHDGITKEKLNVMTFGVGPDGTVPHTSTDSDVLGYSSTADSQKSDSSKKKRKDKSSLRKSSLNKSDYDITARRTGEVTSEETADNLQVLSGISKFSNESADKSKETTKKEEDRTPKKIARQKDFSSLLQKFSSSDQSGSENEQGQTSPRRKFGLNRQEAYALNSSDDSGVEGSRRTPERTQSLRLKKSPSPEKTMETKGVQRAGSFKSEFMRRSYSPKSEMRERLAAQTDKPTEELASVLNKRHRVVDEQDKIGQEIERQKISDKSVEKESNLTSAAEVEDVIADSEVAAALRSRRKVMDSNTVTDEPKLGSKVISSHESSNKASSQQDDKSKTVSSEETKLELTDIDTSLAVLNAVTEDILDSDDTVKSPETKTLADNLSKVHVDSPEEVVQFIKDIQKSTEVSKSVQSTKEIKNDNSESNKLYSSSKSSSTQSEKPSSKVEVVNKDTHEKSTELSSRSKSSEIKEKFTSSVSNISSTSSSSSPVPSSVTSSLAKSSNLKRTESVGRSESMDHRPKGILKRTPSLKQSGIIVDPELANILQKRRIQQGDVEEEGSSTGISVEKDIEETLRREKEIRKSVGEGEEDGEDKGGLKLSMTERIYQMENLIEETNSKSCPITPRSKSGTVTPKLKTSFDEKLPSHVSGEQLIEKLTHLVDKKGDSLEDRRKQFQKRNRDDWRTRTQPVTLEEIQEADGSEVLRKASTNTFENLNKQSKAPVGKKTEFPQPFHREKGRRSRGERYKTLPVTLAELNAIPEGERSDINTLQKKVQMFGVRDSKADSGILSGSEMDRESLASDCSLRSLSIEMDISEDDPARLSVSAKASMFKQIEEKEKSKPEKKSASGAKRYIDRKKRERSRTQPVTEDEVKTAAEYGHTETKKAEKREIRGILKADAEKPSSTSSEPAKGILKNLGSDDEKHESESKGILKSLDKELVKQSSLEQKSILRHRDSESETVENDQSKLDKGILKHSDPLLAEIKSVLRESSPEKTTSQKSILKKESSFEAKQTEPEKGVLKKTLSGDTSIISSTVTQQTEKKLDDDFKNDTKIEKDESKDSKEEVEESKDTGDDTESTPSSDREKANGSSRRRFRDRKDRTNERLNALKQSGETEWKKKVVKELDFQPGAVQEVKMREKKVDAMPRPSSIADRLNMLETSQIGWKGRVEESDAKMFTLEHKLGGPPIVQAEPKVEVVQEEEEQKGPTKVELFDMNDDHLQSFFQVRQSTELTDKIDVTVDDMNDLFISANDILEPYKDLMLLHVKGRRRVQVRLVEPCAKSVNSGDCYILVMKDKVINWVGEYCNVIEKAKAADVATVIWQKKDLGCKMATSVTTVEEKRQHLGPGKVFWKALGGMEKVEPAGPTEEDELYENHIVETNMIYHMVENALVPYKEYWGTQPKVEMLKKDEVIVFDFGSEMYVWQGKSVKPDQRKIGVKLARQLWERGYDYSNSDINPLCPLLSKAEDMEGFIREQDIVTLGINVWHVLEYDHFQVPEHSQGQFHDGDTYVVRWQYMITNKGMKDLKGTQSRRSLVGRERCAYFFWQGKESTINEKGASALMTVELDEERGPQVRVPEGKEMPCFLNLFDGNMIIHKGKREDESTNTQGCWRCYCLRGDYENNSEYKHTLRLFSMSSVSGVFEVHEILNPSRTPDYVSSYPVLQSDLYKSSQPDNPPKAYTVYAGVEPLLFTNLFPYWDVDETARMLNLRDGKVDDELTPLEEVLERVTQAKYSFDELMERPLPEGVDPLRLESYLEDEEFENLTWKASNLLIFLRLQEVRNYVAKSGTVIGIIFYQYIRLSDIVGFMDVLFGNPANCIGLPFYDIVNRVFYVTVIFQK